MSSSMNRSDNRLNSLYKSVVAARVVTYSGASRVYYEKETAVARYDDDNNNLYDIRQFLN